MFIFQFVHFFSNDIIFNREISQIYHLKFANHTMIRIFKYFVDTAFLKFSNNFALIINMKKKTEKVLLYKRANYGVENEMFER